MIKIKEALVVEGNYDKIKLSRLFDTTIVVTDGFMIFKNKSMMNMLKKLADKNGIIIFTDSDRAGFQIRNYIKNVLKGIYIFIKNSYRNIVFWGERSIFV
jgi:ribonuclease M5